MRKRQIRSREMLFTKPMVVARDKKIFDCVLQKPYITDEEDIIYQNENHPPTSKSQSESDYL